MRRRIMSSKNEDYEKYLKFTATKAGTFQFSGTGISYSLNNGSTWTSLAANTATPTVAAGSSIMWKGTMTPAQGKGVGTFNSTGNFTAEGNPMCLLFGNEFEGETVLTGKNYAFCRLFFNCKLTSIDNFVLPATTLADYCYQYMFYNCTNLTTIPSNLLPATTLVNNCYQYMFGYCESLTTSPELPATTLANNCYNGMFKKCTSLTTAPELPATTLANNCYYIMFDSCTSITTAPELPATTLVDSCYGSMFRYCSSLNYIKAMFTTTPSNSYTNSWVYDVASTGTFVKNLAATWNVTGANGIPSGWTVQTASS